MSQPRQLSVLIPFYNEAGNVAPLLDEIHDALAGIDYEIVCVNDCSDDATGGELEEARRKAPKRITVRTHVARAGKSAALMTGLRAVTGTWTQLLDGDGQNDIADTRRVWDAVIAPGNTGPLGLIAGKRKSRNDSGFKWLQSRIANGIRRFMLRDDATDTGCGWKLMRTDAFRELPYFASMHRFLPALMKRAGWEVREEPVNDRRRWHGQSKYGFLGRLGAGAADLFGVFWLVRRGQPGIAQEWNDPRAGAQSSVAKKSS
ncbi:glycosyltransferase family 2 protein [Henriciella sp.]|uniref:glycosyltransferase family 2 protein n=1 Tax=Henriciella sp. TaxID=1968823 RepID=UPI0026307497|nr:glycosyltransferase family 2 protein [Henriciella sp.]